MLSTIVAVAPAGRTYQRGVAHPVRSAAGPDSARLMQNSVGPPALLEASERNAWVLGVRLAAPTMSADASGSSRIRATIVRNNGPGGDLKTSRIRPWRATPQRRTIVAASRRAR